MWTADDSDSSTSDFEEQIPLFGWPNRTKSMKLTASNRDEFRYKADATWAQTRDDETLQQRSTPPLQIMNKMRFVDAPIPEDLKQQIVTGQLWLKDSQDTFINIITHVKDLNKQLFRQNRLLIMKQRKLSSMDDPTKWAELSQLESRQQMLQTSVNTMKEWQQ